LNLDDLLQTDSEGHGIVNILAADKLLQSPKVYTTFLLWLLSELFEQLPEAGDLDKPKLVFFFDEAHLLFNEARKRCSRKSSRSFGLSAPRGVGIYFVTQNPMDVPEVVLGQLGNRVQHALRAFTPKDQKAVRAAAQTFRANPGLDVEKAITELGVGEALVSFLDDKGVPSAVQRGLICPPVSFIGPVAPSDRERIVRASLLYGHYEKSVGPRVSVRAVEGKGISVASCRTGKRSSRVRRGRDCFPNTTPSRGRQPDTMAETMMKSVVRAAGSQMGRSLIRGVLGSILGGRR
jgi:hypothetical protein